MNRTRGHPKNFESGEELIALWQEFCDDIVSNKFYTIPSQTAFCRWMSEKYKATDRRTIYNSLHKYFPEIKKEFEQIQSDTMMQGGMMGAYNPTMSIFGLKNWCGWADKMESTNNNTDVVIDFSGLEDDD